MPRMVTGNERNRMEDEGSSHRAIGWRREKRLDRELVRGVKPAYRPGSWHRHAYDQNRHHEERSIERERNMKGP